MAMSLPPPPPPPPTTSSSNTNRLSENIKHWSHITNNLLESWMNDKVSDKKLIIIDSRSPAEYNHLHIKNALNIGYSKIMRRRLLRDNYPVSELLLKNSSNNIIDYQETNVVVYDNQSEHTNQLEADSFALILINKLVQKFKSVSFLTGGFVAFHSKYVSLCQPTLTPLQGPMVMAISPASSNTSSASASLTTTPNEQFSIPAASAPPVPHGGELTSPAYLNRISQSNLNLQVSSSRYEKIIRFRSDFTLLDTFALANMSQNSTSVVNCTKSGPAGKPEGPEQPSGMREPTKILDFLFLGSQEDALSEVTMNALNITNVLNVSQTCPKPDFIPDAHFLRIPVNDGHAARLIPFFDVGFRFIEKCRKANSKVIIHCLAGISRSPTLAIAYLMRYLNLNSDEAYNFVKQRRTTISPNLNFVGQLYEYEKQLQANNNANNAEKAATNMTPAGSFESLLKLGNDENNSSAGVSFLKIRKKLQNSVMPSPNVSDNNYSNNFPNQNPADSAKPPVESSNDSSNTVQKFSPPKIQRRKTYMFSPNNTTNASISSSSLSSNLCLVQANTPLCLQSPSTALQQFDLNSPTATQTMSIDSTPSAQPLAAPASETPVIHRCVPKSFTLDTINLPAHNKHLSGTLESLNASIEQKLVNSSNLEKTTIQTPIVRSAVQMRRPTNFLTNLSPSSPMTNPVALFSFFSPAFPATKECSTDDSSDAKSGSKTVTPSVSAKDAKEIPKRLKRPSSFLSGFTKESPGVFMSPFEAFKMGSSLNDQNNNNEFRDSSNSSSLIGGSGTASQSTDKAAKVQRPSLTCFQQHVQTTTPQNLLNVNTTKSFFARTYSNTSAGSTASSCSCCSNISTTSSTLSSANTSTSGCQCHLGSNNISNHSSFPPHQTTQSSESDMEVKSSQRQDSASNLKKMKLSPTKDQDAAAASSLTGTSGNSTTESQANAMDVSNSPVNENSNHEQTSQTSQPSSTPILPPASLLFNRDNILAGLQQSKGKIEFRFSNSNNTVLTGSATTPTYINATLPCILNSFSSRLNESKSYETIKTLLDQKEEFKTGRVQRSSENATDKRFKSFESESDEEAKTQREDSVESKLKNSSALLSSLVNIMPPNTSKSSSSSSKTGSNKNSLHGSIETMIPVS